MKLLLLQESVGLGSPTPEKYIMCCYTATTALMALVSSGKMFGSLNMKRHAIGPRLKYVLRNVSKGPFNSTSSESAIRITTSGLSRP